MRYSTILKLIAFELRKSKILPVVEIKTSTPSLMLEYCSS